MTEDLLSLMYQEGSKAKDSNIGLLRQAMPYRLDDEATTLMVEYMLSLSNKPRAIERTRILARAPQTIAWIEWNNITFMKTQERIAGRFDETPEEVPPRRGYLVKSQVDDGSRYSVVPVVELAQTGKPMSLPFGLILSTEEAVKPRVYNGLNPKLDWIVELESEWNRQVQGDVLWSCLNCPKNLREAGMVRFSEPFMTSLVTLHRDKGKQEAYHTAVEILNGVINTVHGFARTVTSMICLLNEVPIKRFIYQPVGHFRAGGNMKPFLKNSIISIHLEKGRSTPLKMMQGLVREAAWRCRAHMVKGYWRADLVHTFDNPPGESWTWQWSRRHRRECWQVWIKPHQRGDASLGWVNQEYEVTR